MWKLGLIILLALLASVTLVMGLQIGRKRETGAASGSAVPSGATVSGVSPTAHESIVPGKLTVDVYVHSLESPDGRAPCWTYVSNGLWPLGQREIVFTVKRRPGEADGAYPRDLLQFYELVYHLAVQKQLVDIGGDTTLSPDGAGLLGREDFRGVLYVPPQPLDGVQIRAPWLTALILTANELRVARSYGMFRLMTIFGSRYRFFPTAPWADRDRPELVAPQDMESSLLSKMRRSPLHAASVRLENLPGARKVVPAPYGLTDQTVELGPKRVVLRIRPAAVRTLKELISHSEAGTPIALLTDPDPSADSYVKWQAGKKEFSAISKSGAAGELIGGNFIAFVPQGKEDGCLAVEDGFAVLLRDESWNRLRASFGNGKPISIAATGDKMPFVLVWAPEIEPDFADPIESQFPGGWSVFDGGSDKPAAGSKSASLRNVVMLTTNDVVSRRIEVKPFADYVKSLEAAVESFLGTQPPGQATDLAFLATLRPDGTRDVELLTRPEAKGDLVRGLKEAFTGVRPPPPFFGPVRFQLNFVLWAGRASPLPHAREP